MLPRRCNFVIVRFLDVIACCLYNEDISGTLNGETTGVMVIAKEGHSKKNSKPILVGLPERFTDQSMGFR